MEMLRSQMGVQSRPVPTFAEVVATAPKGSNSTFDSSAAAIEGRRRDAARLKALISARDLSEPDDPMRGVLSNQIEELRRSADQTQAPGQRLDEAMRRVAELKIKKCTAENELEKQRTRLNKVTDDLTAGEQELMAAQRAVAAPSAPLAAVGPSADPIAHLKHTLATISSSGFRLPPGNETLCTAMDFLWSALDMDQQQAPDAPGDAAGDVLINVCEEEEADPTDEEILEAFRSLAPAARRRITSKRACQRAGPYSESPTRAQQTASAGTAAAAETATSQQPT